jgi:hypothetical protein
LKNHKSQKPHAEFHLVRCKRRPEFVGLVVGLIALVGCGVATQAEIPLSSVAKEIEARGYRVQQRSSLPPNNWEIAKFRLRRKVAVTFKAEKPLPNERENYYCRFILFEETYDSHDEALARLSEIHEISPDAPVEERHDSALREGFVVDRTVYFLQTDAVMFFPEVQRLTKLLASKRSTATS